MQHTMRERSNKMATASRRSSKGRGRGLAAGSALGCLSLVFGLSSVAGAAPATTGRGSATSGSVATITGSTMEVQSTTAQTAVTWTPTTTFSETATETVSAIAVGDCLTVTGTPSKKSKTTIAARSITISKPSTTGTCTGGFGGAAGGAPAGGFGGARAIRCRSRAGRRGQRLGLGGDPAERELPRPFRWERPRGIPRCDELCPRHGQGDGGQRLDRLDVGDTPESALPFVQLEVDEADEAQDAEAQDHDREVHDTVGDPSHHVVRRGGRRLRERVRHGQ